MQCKSDVYLKRVHIKGILTFSLLNDKIKMTLVTLLRGPDMNRKWISLPFLDWNLIIIHI